MTQHTVIRNRPFYGASLTGTKGDTDTILPTGYELTPTDLIVRSK